MLQIVGVLEWISRKGGGMGVVLDGDYFCVCWKFFGIFFGLFLSE